MDDVSRAALQADLLATLGPDGRLARRLGGYEHRPGQEAMMTAVARALSDHERLVVEAGTGVGKTLAYLVPAVLAGEPVIISTGTKALQEQLFHKDVQLVRDILDVPFEAALLKGRTNYLCLTALDEAVADPQTPLFHRGWLDRIRAWAGSTPTGDRAEIGDLPDDAGVWSRVSTGSEACLGQGCPAFARCFVMKARRRAAAADLVVVNHHLLFADLGLRERADFSLLPEAAAVIFDEAHNIEDVAAMHFGSSVSDRRVLDLVADVARHLRAVDRAPASLHDQTGRARHLTEALFAAYAALLPRARVDARDRPADALDILFELDAALASLGQACREASADEDPAATRLAERCGEVRDQLYSLVTAEERDIVVWVERGPRATFLRGAPIEVASLLATSLYARYPAVVFTSATLATGGNFEHFRSRVGLDEDALELAVPSPFDYGEQALLYLPPEMPEPRDPGFVDAVAEQTEALLRLTAGRALVLFTSFANMRAVHQRLSARGLPFSLLLQGEGTKEALLRRLRDEPGTVLLATATFWEGVDVVGEALSLVVIDKLPFAPPDDPLTSARCEHLAAEGRSAFMHYQVPQATIALKQGFGRLVRTGRDRGIVAILDRRLTTARYGARLLQSLPPARRVYDLAELAAAWAGMAADRQAGCNKEERGSH